MRMLFLRAILLGTALFVVVNPAAAVIKKLTHLDEVLESQKFIFVASVEKIDPEKPSAIFKVEKKIKGEPPFERMPVNMTGDDEAKKANDTKTILERLDPSRKVVIFAVRQSGRYEAMAFVEGSWFSLQGTPDPDTKTIRWAFLHGEPFLRRTFKGTTAEMVKVIEDGLANKAKPPKANEDEKPGYGPAVEKSAPKKCDDERSRDPEGSACEALPSGSRLRGSLTVFGVIPSVVLLGPLAIVAALFPGVFARMAIGMKRWRAFLVVASINSTLALLYWLVQEYLPSGPAFGLKAFTIYLTIIAFVGLSWAGRRYRRMVGEDPTVTNIPSKTELYSLAGLSAFAGLSALLVAWFANWQWNTNLELPLREFTFIGISLVAATLYAGYRFLTQAVDHLPNGSPPERRLSISGEMIGLGALVLCGFTFVVAGGTQGPIVTGTQTGDADAIGPRLLSAKAVELYELDEGQKEPVRASVGSNVVASGDRLYFGLRNSFGGGRIVCVNPDTGELVWSFGEKLKDVFCPPVIVDGKLFCGEGTHDNTDCRMFCVNAADGKAAWEKPFQTASHTEGAPSIANGKLFFPAGDDGLFAIDTKTGTQKLWHFPGGKAAGIHIDAAPAVSGNRVFVGSGLYTFVAVALDTETGKELWRTDLKHRAFGAPLVLGKHVYFGVGTGNLGADTHDYPEEGEKKEKEAAGAVVCLDVETGEEKWRFQEMTRSVHTGLAGDAFSVYAGSRDGTVYAIDRKSGKLRWKTGIGSAIVAQPAVATAGVMPLAVYAVSREGTLVCLNPHTGKVVWQQQLPGYHWDGKEENGVFCGPVVVTTPTPTGSKRTIFVGGVTVDPNNPAKKTAAIFRFEDEIGGD